MKKRMLALLKQYGFELDKFFYQRSSDNWHHYEVEYKDSNGNNYGWIGEYNPYDFAKNSLNGKDGMFKSFEANVISDSKY